MKWSNQDAFAKRSLRHFDVIREIPLDLVSHEPQRASLCPLTPKLDPYERYFTPVAMILSIVCLHVAASIIYFGFFSNKKTKNKKVFIVSHMPNAVY